MVETQVVLSPTSEDRGAAIDTTALDPIPQAPVLRVVTSAAEVHWSGRSVILSHQLFPVFQRLLDKALTRDPVASGPYLEDTSGREAKDLIRELRNAFKALGFTDAESKTLIATVRGRGYRLSVTASEVLVED